MEIKLSDVLSKPELLPEGWLFLPLKKEDWNINTMGMFIEDSYDIESDVAAKISGKYKDWIEVLDNASIEDVVENAKVSVAQCGLNDLLNALIFYFENDSFKY